jgi:2-keto-3-deoxy-L-rhamnonate aldolase RhmA
MQAGLLTHAFSLKMFDNIEVVHYAAAAGYDAILVDLEHGTLDLGKASQLSVAALQVG